MRTIITTFILCCSLAFGYSGGTGSLHSPYVIATTQDVIDLSETAGDWGKSFTFISDIDMAGYYILPIAEDTQNPFGGKVMGNGHTISNLNYNGKYQANVGFFGNLSPNARINDLRFENVRIFTADTDLIYAGVIAGTCNGRITNCEVVDSIVEVNSEDYASCGLIAGRCNNAILYGCKAFGKATASSKRRGFAGGIVGYSNKTIIDNCYSKSEVFADAKFMGYAGGIVAYLIEGEILQCFSEEGIVSAKNTKSYTGGIAGEVYSASMIASHSSCDVLPAGKCFTGGLIGRLYYSRMSDSYFNGRLPLKKSKKKTGGIAAIAEISRITGCIWDIDTSLCEIPVGSIDGYEGIKNFGLNSEQMLEKDSYLAAGWQFDATDDSQTPIHWQWNQGRPPLPNIVEKNRN